MARRASLLLALLAAAVVVLVLGQEEVLQRGEEGAPFGESCLDHFTTGFVEFILDTDASVQSGAIFLGSPELARGRDCVRACCKALNYHLALVEQQIPEGSHDDGGGIQICSLLNCLYDQTFVCKFATKAGFFNYVKKEVYDAYEAMWEQGTAGLD